MLEDNRFLYASSVDTSSPEEWDDGADSSIAGKLVVFGAQVMLAITSLPPAPLCHQLTSQTTHHATTCPASHQGSLCATPHARYITEKGGHVLWLGRDVRNNRAGLSTRDLFQHVLRKVGEGGDRKVLVSVHLKSVTVLDCPGVSIQSSVGFSVKEMMDMCFEAGADSNVSLGD